MSKLSGRPRSDLPCASRGRPRLVCRARGPAEQEQAQQQQQALKRLAVFEKAAAGVNRALTAGAETHKGKEGLWYTVRAKGKGRAGVTQARERGKGLGDYLALPVEKYSMLNPEWVARQCIKAFVLPSRDAETGQFIIQVPLKGLSGVDMAPRIWIDVAVDPGSGEVRFSSPRAELGQAQIDQHFRLQLRGSLRAAPKRAGGPWWKLGLGGGRPEEGAPGAQAGASAAADPDEFDPSGDPPGGSFEALPPEVEAAAEALSSGPAASSRRGEGMSPAGGPPSSTAPAPGAGSGPAGRPGGLFAAEDRAGGGGAGALGGGEVSSHGAAGVQEVQRLYSEYDAAKKRMEKDATHWLEGQADVSAEVQLPPAFRALPQPLVRWFGGVVAKLVLNALLPGFLGMLSRDYSLWAAGADRAQFYTSAKAAALRELEGNRFLQQNRDLQQRALLRERQRREEAERGAPAEPAAEPQAQ